MQRDGVAGTEQNGGNGRADIADPTHQHRRAFRFDHQPPPRYGKLAIAYLGGAMPAFPERNSDLGASLRPGAPSERRHIVGGRRRRSVVNTTITFEHFGTEGCQ
jgi:hypothetical protein